MTTVNSASGSKKSLKKYVSNNALANAVNMAATDLFTFAYKHVIKPHMVFNIPPDEAHDRMIALCKSCENNQLLMWLLRSTLNYTDPVLETDVMGLHFDNPFGLSAGLAVSYTHLRAHETGRNLVCRLLLEKKKISTRQFLL